MCTHFRILISRVLSFMTQGDNLIWQRGEQRNTSLSLRKRKKTENFCKFKIYLCWQNKVCVVLKFRIYHVWLQGKIRTSLLMTWLISGTYSLLLTKTTTLFTKTTLPLKTPPYHNYKRVTVGDRKESFDRGNQKIYPTHMMISIIILMRM